MKKLIKQDILILLSLIAAYHPGAADSISCQAQGLNLRDTRDYLMLLRDGQCRIRPYGTIFQPDSPDGRFWTEEPKDAASVRALHLHLTRMARDSPEGSVIVVEYDRMRPMIENIRSMPQEKRQAAVNSAIHYSITHTQLCSTADFIHWLKGGDRIWT